MTAPDQSAGTLSTLAGSWTLDPTRCSVAFSTKAMWLFTVHGTVKAISGRGAVGPDGSVSGSLVFDAASFDTRNKRRDTHLRSADFFEVGAYPTFAYAVTGARPLEAGRYEVEGTLTIRDQSRPVTVLADVQATETAATVTAEVDIDRAAWGLTWAKMGTALANRVVISARFTKS
jgi:polyisoprenoid-binding protein YceI